MKRLVIIDGKSVFYRGYYAMPSLSTADGKPTGGVFGFVSLALEIIRQLEPDYVAVAWDKSKTNIRKRQQIYPEYKAGRKPAPDDFYEQIPILHELLEAFGWPLYEIDDYEADDIMATFAVQAEARGVETCLVTSDLDALQSLSPLTKVYAMKRGFSQIEEFDPIYFKSKYGIKPEQFLDLKALMGDSSDNLPGVPGVGQKTATKLLEKYDNLDSIYDNLQEISGSVSKKLEEGRELAYLTKKLAKLYKDVPLELDWAVADVEDCDFQKISDILRRLEFHSLLKKLPENMQGNTMEPAERPEVKLEPLPAEMIFNEKTCLYIDMGTLYLASMPDMIYFAPVKQVSTNAWRALEMSKIIAYDAKELYHQLDKLGVSVRFSQIHDIRQTAFLLEPLRRDRSLAGLVADEIEDDSPELAIQRMCEIYERQSQALAKDDKLRRIAEDFDFPLIYVLFQMEKRGIKLDASLLETMKQEIQTELTEIEQKMCTYAGCEFNVASPNQLSEVLFTKLQLPTAGIRRGKTGYSTGQKELNKLRGKHPIIELIERYRELAKLMSTYIEALPPLLDEQGFLHTTFNQDVTSTGRLSSTNPNLQNIPVRSELGRKIRQAFVPREGKVFVNADYSQFELRLAAVLAGDTSLIEDFNSGLDIHTKTAAEVYGRAMEEVTPEQRRAAKVINFGVLYGMSPHGLAEATDMTFGDAKRFIDQYFELRQPIRDYLDKILKQATEKGFVETYFGRRRPTPDVKSSNFMVRESAKRAAMNMPIQGTEADLMKLAMIRLEDKLAGLGEQILQIHDSILVECSPENASEVSQILKKEMESIAPELPIRLQVDVKIGKNWREV